MAGDGRWAVEGPGAELAGNAAPDGIADDAVGEPALNERSVEGRAVQGNGYEGGVAVGLGAGAIVDDVTSDGGDRTDAGRATGDERVAERAVVPTGAVTVERVAAPADRTANATTNVHEPRARGTLHLPIVADDTRQHRDQLGGHI